MARSKRARCPTFILKKLLDLLQDPKFRLTLAGIPAMDFTEVLSKWEGELDELLPYWDSMYQCGGDDLGLVIGRIIETLKLHVTPHIVTCIDQSIANFNVLEVLQPLVPTVNAPRLDVGLDTLLLCHIGIYRDAVGKIKFTAWAHACLAPLVQTAFDAQRDFLIQQKAMNAATKKKAGKQQNVHEQNQNQKQGLVNNGGNGAGRKKKGKKGVQI